MKKYLKNEGGFSLIEVLVGVSLASVIMLSIIPLFWGSIFLNTESRNENVALWSARQRIEEIRNMTFDSVIALPASETVDLPDLPSEQRKTEIKNSYGADIKEIVITCNWQGKTGPKTISINTLVSRNGIISK